MDITQRDKDVIRQVARFRFLRSGQIVSLIGGSSNQVRRRLQALYHHGYLDRPRCQIDYFHRGGSRPMVYGLGSRGAALMRREFDMPFHRIVWSRKGPSEGVGRLFLEHTLMVADVLTAAEIATRGSAGNGGSGGSGGSGGHATAGMRFVAPEELTGESKKREPFHWSTTVNGRRVGLVPDGVFGIETGNSAAPKSRIICLLEADRGTMPITRCSRHLSSIARKLAAYTALWKSGAFEKRFDTKRLAIFIVTTSEARAKNIAEAVEALPVGKGLFSCHALDAVVNDAGAMLARCAPQDRWREI